MEMTLRQLQVGDAIDHRDFLDRVDTLGALGKTVLISNFLRYHRLVTYLSRYTQKPIGLPLGLVRLRDVLDEKFYTDLEGGLMESLGQLFKNGAKLYVYPSLDRKTGKLITVENLEVAPHLRHLYAHLVENRFVENIRNYNPDVLNIYSGDVLDKIQAGDAAWEKLVPPPIVEVIKAKQLFGWNEKPADRTSLRKPEGRRVTLPLIESNHASRNARPDYRSRISVHNGFKSSSASAIFRMASRPPTFIACRSQCRARSSCCSWQA